MIRLKDLDEWREEYTGRFLYIALMLGVVGGTFLYLALSTYRWRPKWPGPGDPDNLLTGGVAISLALLSVYAYYRTRSTVRVLRIDPAAGTYEIVVGWFRPEVVGSGGFDDIAEVRLASRVRRVYGQRHVSRRAYWAVSLVWKDPGREPFCVEEVRGAVVTPAPWGPKSLYRGEYHRSQAALARWAKTLGVPAVDTTLDADESAPG